MSYAHILPVFCINLLLIIKKKGGLRQVFFYVHIIFISIHYVIYFEVLYLYIHMFLMFQGMIMMIFQIYIDII